MTPLSPTALEAAAKAVEQDLSRDMAAWVERYTGPHGCDDDAPEPPKGNYRSTPARLATAAITAYLAQAQKEGWVMVPVEPTRGMVCAYIQSVKSSPKGNPNRGRDGKDEWMAAHTEKCSKRWRAMLAAAQNGADRPAPPMGK